ncbi:MAG: hypothetical protein RSK76_04450, partial [Clostridia bacterium]
MRRILDMSGSMYDFEFDPIDLDRISRLLGDDCLRRSEHLRPTRSGSSSYYTITTHGEDALAAFESYREEKDQLNQERKDRDRNADIASKKSSAALIISLCSLIGMIILNRDAFWELFNTLFAW